MHAARDSQKIQRPAPVGPQDQIAGRVGQQGVKQAQGPVQIGQSRFGQPQIGPAWHALHLCQPQQSGGHFALQSDVILRRGPQRIQISLGPF